MTACDVAIAGLGAMGSAVAHHAALRGARVVGFDRFAPPHALGSSHGETRIIREAYFEDPRYVPIVQRAYDLWLRLERDAGRRLLQRTGGLMIGPEGGALVRGAIASGEAHRLPHQRLDAAELRRRFPALAPRDHEVAVWEPRAGMLFPEACIAAQLEAARRAGATLRPDDPVTAWRATGASVEVETAAGRVSAGVLVLAANAWLPLLAPDLPFRITVTRQVLHWFEPAARPERLEPDRLGIWIWEDEPGRFMYGFPAVAGQVKVAVHGEGSPTGPDALDRTVGDDEVGAMRVRLASRIPDAAGASVRAAACMYANTADGHFVIDRHPGHPNVLVLSCCSGHGFKFASAIGEIAAQLALDGRSTADLGLFAMRAG
jgi:sarcosine oxidase